MVTGAAGRHRPTWRNSHEVHTDDDTLAGLALALLTSLGATQASTAVAPAADTAPASRLAAAGIDASRLAPGWTIDNDNLVWDNGAVMASLSPSAASDCDSGYVCFFEDKSYTGRKLQFRDTGLRANMNDYSFNDKMSSWVSRRSLDARWYYNYGGTGTSRCIASLAKNPDVGAGASNFDNDEMSSFRIYSTSTAC